MNTMGCRQRRRTRSHNNVYSFSLSHNSSTFPRSEFLPISDHSILLHQLSTRKRSVLAASGRFYSSRSELERSCSLCFISGEEHCWRLEKLPKAMGKLINLKHLYVEGCGDPSGLPKGVGRLRGLRILDGFVCGGGDDKEILELVDLGSFEHLQGTTLQISKLGNVKDAREQAQKAQLEKKKHIIELKLDFGRNSGELQRISDEEVLNALRPHPDLKSLIVWKYKDNI